MSKISIILSTRTNWSWPVVSHATLNYLCTSQSIKLSE